MIIGKKSGHKSLALKATTALTLRLFISKEEIDKNLMKRSIKKISEFMKAILYIILIPKPHSLIKHSPVIALVAKYVVISATLDTR